MGKSQKISYENPAVQTIDLYLIEVLCTSATTTAWYEDGSYDYSQLD